MKRAYVVVGKLQNDVVDDYYAVCHSMERADELCLEAEAQNPRLEYTWYPAVEEDD
jgi:hypothetical protein